MNVKSHMPDPIKKPNKKQYPKKPKVKKVAQRGAANIYGYHAVEAAWLNKDRIIKSVFATDSAWQTFQKRLDASPLLHDLTRPDPLFLSKAELDKILPGTVNQGLAIEAEPLPELSTRDMIIRQRDKDHCVFLMLDQVTDPHNVGAILRSACAFGVCALIQQRRHAPAPENVLAKTASGALEHVPWVEETNLAQTLEFLNDNGYTSFALDEQGTDIHRFSSQLPKKAVLVLGAEGKGLRPKVKQTCKHIVKLPTTGPISSLNVSNAAAVSLYALTNML